MIKRVFRYISTHKTDIVGVSLISLILLMAAGGHYLKQKKEHSSFRTLNVDDIDSLPPSIDLRFYEPFSTAERDLKVKDDNVKSFAVKSLSEMESLVSKITENGVRINSVLILAHANSTGICFNDTSLTASVIDKPENADHLIKIGKALEDNSPYILFEGCNIGKAENFLRTVSRLTRLTTVGYTEYQYAWLPFYMGDRVECNSTYCQNNGNRSYSLIQAPLAKIAEITASIVVFFRKLYGIGSICGQS